MKDSADFVVEGLHRPIQIVYSDEDLIAAFKPAGVMVHRGASSSEDEPVLLQALRDQLQQFLYPIHRLDRPTAGLVLMARSSAVAGKLGEQFMAHRVQKHYQALVRGYMPDECTVDRPLLHPKYFEERFSADHPLQSATTHFRCLRRFEVPWPASGFATARFSLLEIRPESGRWHQIRRHLNHIGHPVIGDHRHGDHRWNQMFYQRTGIYRMLLTAMRLDFRHPSTDELMSLLVGRGEAFDQAIEQLARASC
ncbi:MAG: pseudouridine synthase [Pirellula sp.]|jgi:tRNA pseudouridine65 synthase